MASVLMLNMTYTTEISKKVPAFQEHQAGVGGVLACGSVSEIRMVNKEP